MKRRQGKSDPEMGNAIPDAQLSMFEGPGQLSARNGQSLSRPNGGRSKRQGKLNPEMGNCAPDVLIGTRFSCDWGSRDGSFIIDEAGQLHVFKTLRLAIERLPAGAVLAIEKTFESYDLVERNAVVVLAKARGVDLRAISPRSTENYRRLRSIEKSNENDARVIFSLVHETNHHWVRPTTRSIGLERTLKQDLVGMRRSGYSDPSSLNVKQILAAAGLGKPKPWQMQHARVAMDVVKRSGNRKLYDREVGTCEHGHPSQARASFMRDAISKAARPDPKRRKFELRLLRKMSRRIFHIVKSAMKG